jgi:hypothetical protein
MKTLPDSIVTGLESGAAHLCHIVIITRSDGAKSGFSDHDQALNFMGVACQPQAAVAQGAAQAELGLAGDNHAAISGVMGVASLRAADIKAGLYDEARVDIYRVNWQVPTDYVLLSSGNVTQIECRGGIDDETGQFIAHIDGLGSQLRRIIGRQFSYLCDAALGDGRCGLSVAAIAGRDCDKRYATCKNRFANSVNFRGFPDIPGEDYVSLYPHTAEATNGTSRAISSGR